LRPAGSGSIVATSRCNQVPVDWAGTPFFPALDERIGLTLLETRIFGSGVVFLRYGVSGPTR
jgi:hypothetical protein